MKSRSTRTLVLGSLMVLVVLTAAAVAYEDIPLRDWTVPMYSLDGLGKAVDFTSPRAFIGLTPCRVFDTRLPAGPFGGPIFANSEARAFTVTGQCGIPAGADAISANFTVTGSPAAPPGAFILAYPTGSPPSPIVSLLNFQAGQTIANAAIVPLNGAGSLTVNVSHSTHVIMDVNGYFSDTLGTPENYFELTTNSGGYTMFLQNLSTSCGGVCGIYQSVASTNSTTSIYGVALAATGANTGVSGEVNSTTDNARGVRGLADASTGKTFGVWGETDSSGAYAAGVLGVDGTGFSFGFTQGNYFPSGVRGDSVSFYGVYGFTNQATGNAGVAGVLVNSGGGADQRGNLGYEGGATDYAVFAQGNYGGTGAKYFVEPHPEKAGTVIRYISLEGPEAGTYVRGRGRFQNGLATIALPEDFRLVTDPEGLSIQVTPIGEMATVAVMRIGLDGIVVKGSRNVEFFYTVNGVRKSHKHLTAMGPGDEYRPETAESVMPAYLTEVQKAALISNGTYSPDGTVNLEMARAQGWTEAWEKRSKAAADKDEEPKQPKK